jgi:hypothetical protein
MHHGNGRGDWRHWALMALCCAPMIVLVVWLVIRAYV